METFGTLDVYLYAFSTSALDGGEWLASRFGHFTHEERAPGAHWTGSWIFLRTSAFVRSGICSPERSNHSPGGRPCCYEGWRQL